MGLESLILIRDKSATVCTVEGNGMWIKAEKRAKTNRLSMLSARGKPRAIKIGCLQKIIRRALIPSPTNPGPTPKTKRDSATDFRNGISISCSSSRIDLSTVTLVNGECYSCAISQILISPVPYFKYAV